MVSNNVVNFGKAGRPSATSNRIVSDRLKDARRALRMTQENLGRLAGVTRQAISSYESGEKSPDPNTFRNIVEALKQPIVYFVTEDREIFGKFSPRFFRKSGPETIRKNDACQVLGGWFVQTAKYIDNFINYPTVSIPESKAADSSGRYSSDEIENVAEECRKYWGLGLGPISNVMALLESKGIAISRYEMEGEKIDAFSFWNGDRPFIFLASEKDAGVRVRYDLLHELGHLIMHRWVDPNELLDPKTLKQIEWEANRFSSAFLLPRNSFPYEVYTPRLEAFIDLKSRWLASIQAMVYRCRDLDVIDEDQFTNLYKQISFRKWRTKEPLDDPSKIRIEVPKMLGRAMEMILDSGVKHPDEILNELGLSPMWVAQFCNLPEARFASRAPSLQPLSFKTADKGKSGDIDISSGN
jgi:Zn-dependent peptidase ImmA (M78 family)/DNA-binding XRE family transcriptional regulator